MDSAACGLACHCLLMWKPIRNYFDKLQICEILVVMTGGVGRGPGRREKGGQYFSPIRSIIPLIPSHTVEVCSWPGCCYCYGATVRLRWVNKTSITGLCPAGGGGGWSRSATQTDKSRNISFLSWERSCTGTTIQFRHFILCKVNGVSSSHSQPLCYNQLITVFYEEHRHQTAGISGDISQMSLPSAIVTGAAGRTKPVSSLVIGVGRWQPCQWATVLIISPSHQAKHKLYLCGRQGPASSRLNISSLFSI